MDNERKSAKNQNVRARIIVLFGNRFLYGSEKANVDVISALKEDYPKVEALFLTDKKNGHKLIHPYLDKLGLRYKPTFYHYRFLRKFDPIGWLIRFFEIFMASLQLIFIVWRFKPTHIFTSKEDYLVNFLPAIYFLKTPVIYRAGDAPIRHHKAYLKVWQYMAKKVKRFVCVSEYIQRELVAEGVDLAKSEVIYSRPHKLGQEAAPPTHTDGKAFTVLYVGQISGHKGVDLFVDAAIASCQKFDQLQFKLAGKIDPENEFATEQLKKVNAAQLNDRIQFLDFVLEVDPLYAEADLHICPSVYEEPLANVLIDAKKHAIPSVIFQVGGLPEIIEHQADGWICQNKSATDLEKAIEYCLINPDLCRQMGRSARASLTKLEIDQFSRKWLDVFTKR